MPETKETIGQRLKQIRLARQISLEKASQATRVRAHYLQALESDNYSAMSSAAQGRGFLRLYADYLGLDLEAAMTDLRQEDSVDATSATPASAPATQPPAPNPAPQASPASSADGKPGRRPFWSRLLRRPEPEAPASEEIPSDAAPAAAEETTPEPVTVPEPKPAPTRAKKPVSKKAAAPAKASKPKTVKPKAAAKPTATSSLAEHPAGAKGKKADKKKAPLKNKSSKKR